MRAGAAPTHWIVVACPPTLTRHIGRFVSRTARAQWRERWAETLFADLDLLLKATPGAQVDKVLAKRPLPVVCARLEARYGPLRLLDARRPHLGKPDDPLTAGQPGSTTAVWAAPLAITTGLSAVLALAD
jgi:hypothetical protein